MKINNIKQRLNTGDKIDKIISDYIKAFCDAKSSDPGYKLIGDGEGIANLGNYNTKPLKDAPNMAQSKDNLKALALYMFKEFYADVYPQTTEMLEEFFKRIYAKKDFYTFDNSCRYSIDSNPELKKMSDDIDALPKYMLGDLFINNRIVEKSESYYKSHIISINLPPSYRSTFVKELFDEVNAVNKSRVNANEKMGRNRNLIRMTVQIPNNNLIKLNEKDSVTIMCNTKDLEDVFNIINGTFEKLSPTIYAVRGEPNKLLCNPFLSVGYDSYDTDFGKPASELIGEIVVRAIDTVIENNKKIIIEPKIDDMTAYRQICIGQLLNKNSKYYHEIVKEVKRLFNQKSKKTRFTYDLDPEMVFVTPLVRDAIDHVYGKRKYKAINSRPYQILDEKRVKKLR